MSSTKKTPNKSVSSSNIIIRYDLTLSEIDVQLDNNEIGMIIVVNSIKYIEIPSTPK